MAYSIAPTLYLLLHKPTKKLGAAVPGSNYSRRHITTDRYPLAILSDWDAATRLLTSERNTFEGRREDWTVVEYKPQEIKE